MSFCFFQEIQLRYNIMGWPSNMWSIVERNVIMLHVTVLRLHDYLYNFFLNKTNSGDFNISPTE